MATGPSSSQTPYIVPTGTGVLTQQFQIQKCWRNATLVCPHPSPLPNLGEGARAGGEGGVMAKSRLHT
jgi:hypothetical protein